MRLANRAVKQFTSKVDGDHETENRREPVKEPGLPSKEELSKAVGEYV